MLVKVRKKPVRTVKSADRAMPQDYVPTYLDIHNYVADQFSRFRKKHPLQNYRDPSDTEPLAAEKKQFNEFMFYLRMGIMY